MEPKSGDIVHFEINTRDPERAKKFYSKAFGWKYKDSAMPGIDYYLFNAFENMQRYMFPLLESECSICGGTYLLQEGVDNPVELCDVCATLSSAGFSHAR